MLLCCNASYLAVRGTDKAWTVYSKLVVIFTFIIMQSRQGGTINRIKQPDRRTQRLEASRPTAHQSKLDLGLVPVRMVGAYSTSVSQSSLAATMPTPLRISPAHAFGCTPSVKALQFQFSNSPAGKSCEPELDHLGAPQDEPEPRSLCFQRL
jgi:hypothetical protein